MSNISTHLSLFISSLNPITNFKLMRAGDYQSNYQDIIRPYLEQAKLEDKPYWEKASQNPYEIYKNQMLFRAQGAMGFTTDLVTLFALTQLAHFAGLISLPLTGGISAGLLLGTAMTAPIAFYHAGIIKGLEQNNR